MSDTRELPPVLPMLGLEGIILKAGGHSGRESGVCAMEAVSWLAGERHSDRPSCACPVIAAFMRDWNDSLPNDDDRTRILRPLLPLLLNTRSTKAVERQRSYLAVDWLARECAPVWLSLSDGLKAHAVALHGLAPLTDAKSCRAAQETLNAARSAAAASRDAAWAAAWDAAWAASRDAAWAAAGAALAPTVTALQISAADLVKRMCAVTA